MACVPSRINLQVKRGDKGFGEATKLFQAQLTDDLSDIEIPCSGDWVHELWETPAKHQEDHRSSYAVQTTVSVTAELPDTTPSAPWKKKPEIAPIASNGDGPDEKGQQSTSLFTIY